MRLRGGFHRCSIWLLWWGFINIIAVARGVPVSLTSLPVTNLAVGHIPGWNTSVLFFLDAYGNFHALNATTFGRIYRKAVAERLPTYTSIRYDAGLNLLLLCCEYGTSRSALHRLHPQNGSVAWNISRFDLSCDKLILGKIEEEIYSIKWYTGGVSMIVLSVRTGQLKTTTTLKTRYYSYDGGSTFLADVVGVVGQRYIFIHDWQYREFWNVNPVTRAIRRSDYLTGYFYPKSYNHIAGILYGIQQNTYSAEVKRHVVSVSNFATEMHIDAWISPRSTFEWGIAFSQFIGVSCGSTFSCSIQDTRVNTVRWYPNGTIWRQSVPLLKSPLDGTVSAINVHSHGATVRALAEVNSLLRTGNGERTYVLSVLDTNTGEMMTHDLLMLDHVGMYMLAPDIVAVFRSSAHFLKLCPDATVYSTALQACVPVNCTATQRWDAFSGICVECATSSYILPDYLGTCILCPAGTDRSQNPSNNTCTKCLPGFVRAENTSLECTRCTGSRPFATPSQHACASSCLPGTYCEPSSPYQMITCPAGWHCNGNAALPMLCLSGHYCEAGMSTPTPCPAGSYNPSSGATNATACMACENGGYICSQGSIEPLACPAGHFCPNVYQSTPCPAGTFNNLTHQASISACKQCPAGSFCSAGAVSVVPCPQGSYCEAGTPTPTACPSGRTTMTNGSSDSSDCIPCSAGTYCVGGVVFPCPANRYCSGWSQSECPPHTYHNLTGQSSVSSCAPCQPGTIRSSNMQVCTACAPGYRWINQTTPQAVGMACERCPLGSIQPAAGALTCLGCPAAFQGNTNRTKCEPCPPGTLKPLPNSDVCTTCPLGYVSDGTGMACNRCPANTYSTSDGVTCMACENGFASLPGSGGCDCVDGTTRMDGVPGCLSCPIPAGCALKLENGASRTGCAEGYEGYLCGVCSDGYFKSVDSECKACGKHWVGFFVFLLLLLGVPMAAFLCLRNVFAIYLLPLRLFVYHIQSLAMVLRLDIPWPANFLSMFSFSFNFTFQLDAAGPECIVKLPYGVKWLSSVGFFFLVLLCLIVLRIYKVFATRESFAKWGQRVVTLAQLTFGIFVAKSYEAFQCVDDYGSNSVMGYLKSDTSVTCWGGAHGFLAFVSTVVLFVSLIWLGVAFIGVTFCDRKKYHLMAGDDASKRYATAPLFRDYKPNSWMSMTFELWLLFQKLIAGSFFLGGADESLGVGAVCALAVVHLVLMLWVRPFKKSDGTLPFDSQKLLMKVPILGRVTQFCSTDTTNKHEMANAISNFVTRVTGLLLLVGLIESAAWVDLLLVAFNIPPLIFTFFAHGTFAEKAKQKVDAMSSKASSIVSKIGGRCSCCKGRNSSILTSKPTSTTSPASWAGQPSSGVVMQVNPLAAAHP